MLLGNENQDYWLASSTVDVYKGGVYFGMRMVYYGKVQGCGLWNSRSGNNNYSFGVRPVVYLKSDIQLTETSTNSGEWNIVEN